MAYFEDTMADFNAVHNAFIDSLSFNDIPQQCKTPSLMALPPGQDRIRSATVQMINSWQNDWSNGAENEDKSKLISEVVEKRALIERTESQNGVLDETRIQSLLADMISGFNDASYQQALYERDIFVATRMADFLNRLGKPVPPAVTNYFSERVSIPTTE